MSKTEALLERLELCPDDWESRLDLIEIAVGDGDLAFAKRLVRASPHDPPPSAEVQGRVHTLLTQGVARSLEPRPEPAAEEIGPTVPADLAKPVEAADPELRPESGSDPRVSASPFRTPCEGGLSALIERDVPLESRRSSAGPARKGLSAPRPDLTAVKAKWTNYEGGLELVPLTSTAPVEAPSIAPERFSAFSLAILLHLVAFVMVGWVVVQTSLPKPPQLVVSVLHEREAELTSTRIVKPSVEIKPAAAAAQSVDVVSSVGTSTFSVPEVEMSDDLIVSSLLPGTQPLGTGMSFSSRAADASEVNFFGLSGSGKRIVFVIDASPEMLVDEKGGMAAYDKVKTEVGVMLTTLNRGTEFNLLLYQGKRLVAFRDAPVPGLPSNLRLALEWLDPLNRRYENLGLGNDFGPTREVSAVEGYPIAGGDLAHYSKAIQKAMEWQAGAIFCVVSGYRGMARAATPEMMTKPAKPANVAPAAPVDPREQKAWQDAVAKTRVWLENENRARGEKGLTPKVVVNFNQLVLEVTGALPPTRRAGPPAVAGLPPVTPEEVERQIAKLVKDRYKADGVEEPSVHLVLFLGEKEEIGSDEAHFKNLTRKNRGKLKILRGLTALQNVTGAK